ncbi:WXG100 family type VII secretion target [Saccharothrix syringae]|uniref:WXG100 family type VII secretion target n=1 Tax=Saccharothrix syringae TaxID=103733 RepID=UPI000524BF91|nr:WXG100 family type VII secretion target [Saccharothrix syringae]
MGDEDKQDNQPGKREDYDHWDWKRVHQAVTGNHPDANTADADAKRLADPESLWRSAQDLRWVQEVLAQVGTGIARQVDALTGDDGPWRGDAATAFRDLMKILVDGFHNVAEQIAGGATGFHDAPVQLWNAGTYLDWARRMIWEINHYYASEIVRIARAYNGEQYTADGSEELWDTGDIEYRTNEGKIWVSWNQQVVDMMTNDMRQVLKSLAGHYEVIEFEAKPQSVDVPQPKWDLGGDSKPDLDLDLDDENGKKDDKDKFDFDLDKDGDGKIDTGGRDDGPGGGEDKNGPKIPPFNLDDKGGPNLTGDGDEKSGSDIPRFNLDDKGGPNLTGDGDGDGDGSRVPNIDLGGEDGPRLPGPTEFNGGPRVPDLSTPDASSPDRLPPLPEGLDLEIPPGQGSSGSGGSTPPNLGTGDPLAPSPWQPGTESPGPTTLPNLVGLPTPTPFRPVDQKGGQNPPSLPGPGDLTPPKPGAPDLGTPDLGTPSIPPTPESPDIPTPLPQDVKPPANWTVDAPQGLELPQHDRGAAGAPPMMPPMSPVSPSGGGVPDRSDASGLLGGEVEPWAGGEWAAAEGRQVVSGAAGAPPMMPPMMPPVSPSGGGVPGSGRLRRVGRSCPVRRGHRR